MSEAVGMRALGHDGPLVSAVGLGCMGMSDIYAQLDEGAGLRTIEAAMDAGVTMLNTGDFYGNGRNELLIARAIKGKRNKAFISVKAGALKSPGGDYIGFDMRPAAMKNWVAHSLSRLGTDYIDLYQPGRIDPQVPIEDTVGALSDLVKEGWIRHIGLSEAGPGSIRRAHSVHPIAAHEVEYSLFGRDIEANILPVCRELGIATIAYSVLAGGLLGGHYRRPLDAEMSLREQTPRFQPGNLEHNLALVERLKPIAADKQVSIATLAIAWVLAQGEDVIPIVGVRRPDRLDDALASTTLHLTKSDLAAIDEVVLGHGAAGSQYAGMIHAMILQERAAI